jgi:hypothetical protein
LNTKVDGQFNPIFFFPEFFVCSSFEHVDAGLTYTQLEIQFLGQLRAPANSLVPNHREVGHRAEVLRHSNSFVEVEDHVPPSGWDEHRLARPLQYFQLTRDGTETMMSSSIQLQKQGWEIQGLSPRAKVLRFAFLGGKRFEVQGSTCQENFFKV